MNTAVVEQGDFSLNQAICQRIATQRAGYDTGHPYAALQQAAERRGSVASIMDGMQVRRESVNAALMQQSMQAHQQLMNVAIRHGDRSMFDAASDSLRQSGFAQDDVRDERRAMQRPA